MSAAISCPKSLPRVLVIGGEDVDARIELMQHLRDEFTLAAAGTSPALAERFTAAGFPYFNYPLGRGAHPLGDVHACVVLRRLLRGFRPQIVHTFDTKPCVYGRLIARLVGVPVVVGTVPGLGSLYLDTGAGSESLQRRLLRRLYEALQRLASSRADLTIFQNRDSVGEFLRRGIVRAEKTALIAGSGVRTEVFDPARMTPADRQAVRAELKVPQESLLVTMVSRVIRSKGVEEFLAAASAVRQRHPETHFLLVGPADDKSLDRFHPTELARLAQTVTWPGARRDIPRILAATDIFVLPSFYPEGIPRVLLEAASMALPLITTRSPGCVDVVEDGVNGLVVPVRDSQALTAALVRLVENPDERRRFGEESRRRAIRLFDLKMVAEQTRTIYQDLLQSCRQRPLLLPSPQAQGVQPLG